MSTSTIFTGASTYSQDFLNVIQRSMAIAELPLVQMQQQQLATSDKQKAVSDLTGAFESLRLSLVEVEKRVTATQLSASLSSSSIASVTLGDSAQKSNFSLEVLNLGSFTSYLSTQSVSDPLASGFGASLTKTLVVDGVETTLALESNTLRGLANAINDSGLGLEASIINVSSTSTASYRLVIQGNKLASQSIALHDGDSSGVNLLDSTALQSGSNVSYKVNGVEVNGENRTVTLAPGIDVALNNVGSTSIQVSRSANRISDAIQSMVSYYNQATTKLNAHRGAAGGVLQGNSSIQNLSQVLRRITGHSAENGAFRSYVDIGLSFDDKGVLSFDSTKLANLSDADLQDLISYLGGWNGDGFLASALQSMNEATDSVYGILTTEKSALTQQASNASKQILALQERLNRMEKDLEERFAVIDATIAAMQQQATYINNLFEAMRVASKSYSS